jgi:hypothetical protein
MQVTDEDGFGREVEKSMSAARILKAWGLQHV